MDTAKQIIKKWKCNKKGCCDPYFNSLDFLDSEIKRLGWEYGRVLDSRVWVICWDKNKPWASGNSLASALLAALNSRGK